MAAFKMVNLTFLSFLSSWLVFIFYQAAAANPFDYKEVSFAVAFVAIVFFMFKYFRDEIKDYKKDNKEITDKFIQVTEQFTSNTEKHTEAIRDLESAIRDRALKDLQELIHKSNHPD